MSQLNEILTINGGSSSIKFAIYQCADLNVANLYGKIDRIGLINTKLIFKERESDEEHSLAIDAHDYKTTK